MKAEEAAEAFAAAFEAAKTAEEEAVAEAEAANDRVSALEIEINRLNESLRSSSESLAVEEGERRVELEQERDEARAALAAAVEVAAERRRVFVLSWMRLTRPSCRRW